MEKFIETIKHVNANTLKKTNPKYRAFYLSVNAPAHTITIADKVVLIA